MKYGNILLLLILAGILALLAAFWSASGYGLGPVKMGGGQPISQETRFIIMVLTLVGAFGAFFVAAASKKLSRRTLGTVALISAVFFIAPLFQGNIFSLISLLLLLIVGITYLMVRPAEKR